MGKSIALPAELCCRGKVSILCLRLRHFRLCEAHRRGRLISPSPYSWNSGGHWYFSWSSSKHATRDNANRQFATDNCVFHRWLNSGRKSDPKTERMRWVTSVDLTTPMVPSPCGRRWPVISSIVYARSNGDVNMTVTRSKSLRDFARRANSEQWRQVNDAVGAATDALDW